MHVTALVNSTAHMYHAAIGLLKIWSSLDRFRARHKFLVLPYPHSTEILLEDIDWLKALWSAFARPSGNGIKRRALKAYPVFRNMNTLQIQHLEGFYLGPHTEPSTLLHPKWAFWVNQRAHLGDENSEKCGYRGVFHSKDLIHDI